MRQEVQEYPCDNGDCKRVMREDDEIVTIIPGDEHYFCSTECAMAFTKRYLMKMSAFELKVRGRMDIADAEAGRLDTDTLNRELVRRGFEVRDIHGNDVSIHTFDKDGNGV